MSNPIRIKRSTVNAIPTTLEEGELAYSELSQLLFIGTNSGADIQTIGGKADHTKLLGIESGAQVNTVGLGVNTFTGKQIFANVSTITASILIPNGSVDPVTPSNGDMWANTGVLKYYNGTSTKSIAYTDSNITGTASNITGTLAVGNGGTGFTSYTTGDILYASDSTTLSKLNDVAVGNVLISGGVGVAPSYGKVNLTAHVSNTLPVTNGGTGSTIQTSNSLVTTDASGNIISTLGVTNTEAGYLSGVGSNIQTQINSKANKNNAIFTGTVTLAQDPTSAMHAVTKQYADSIAQGLDFKNSVKVASSAELTLAGTQTIGGVDVIVGDRILVKDQSNLSLNGVYDVQNTAWTRSLDANSSANINAGLFVFVEEGLLGGSSWVLTTQGTINLELTPLSFAQFGGGTSYAAGTGIQVIGNTISLNSAGFSASYLTSGTVDDLRLSSNVLFNSSVIDGGTF